MRLPNIADYIDPCNSPKHSKVNQKPKLLQKSNKFVHKYHNKKWFEEILYNLIKINII